MDTRFRAGEVVSVSGVWRRWPEGAERFSLNWTPVPVEVGGLTA